MMSSLGDQLCLNISSSLPSVSIRRRRGAQERWLQKRNKAKKRRRSFSHEVKISTNQRKPHTAEEAEPPASEAPPPEPRDGRTSKQKRGQEAGTSSLFKQEAGTSSLFKQEAGTSSLFKQEAGTSSLFKQEAGTSSFKTSSLFKHNPDIPEFYSPLVSQIKEQIFSVTSFNDLHLHPHLVATLNKVLNVSTLTRVQKQTIPVLQAGRDAVVQSQTGSGKTLSYAVPVVQCLQSMEPKVSRSDGPLAVVLVPTRELALQTFQTFQKLLKPFMWIVPGVLMGGEKRKAEKARLRKGINILVSTPGRLVDHIQHTLSIAFSAVRWLILDEADRTLDLGFEKELTVILNSLNSSGPKRQNVLLSATLTNGLTRLVDVCLNDPVCIHMSAVTSDPSLTPSDTMTSDPSMTPSDTVTPDPSPAEGSESFALPETLKQFVVLVPSKIRLVCLAAFILDKCKFSRDQKLIVFISSCEAVEFLHFLFSSVLSEPPANQKAGIHFLRLHGNMKQEDRSDVFQQFSECRSGVLLCTDVAARGLDLPQVTWIVQYTPPTSAAEYVHRVGRTARIGARGSSLLFLTPAETAFITELTNHSFSLSEMKLHDVLSSLMMDDTFKGRGKYHSKTCSRALEQEVRERATVLQTHFENFVHSSTNSLHMAKKGLQSFIRSYTTYPTHLKHAFHIRSLHLGHAAKSFGLRDAPASLTSAPGSRPNRQSRNQTRNQTAGPLGQKRFFPGQTDRGLLCSEFSSGLDKDKVQKKTVRQRGQEVQKKKKKKTFS